VAFHCSNVQTDTFSHGIGETDSLEYSLTSDATAPSDAISGSVDTGARTKLCPSCHTHAVTRHKSGAPTSARKKLVLVQRKDCVGKGAVRLEWNIPFSQDPASRPSLSINFEDIAHIPPFSIQYRTSTLRTRHDRAARQISVASPPPPHRGFTAPFPLLEVTASPLGHSQVEMGLFSSRRSSPSLSAPFYNAFRHRRFFPAASSSFFVVAFLFLGLNGANAFTGGSRPPRVQVSGNWATRTPVQRGKGACRMQRQVRKREIILRRIREGLTGPF